MGQIVNSVAIFACLGLLVLSSVLVCTAMKPNK